jgi:myo-inositol-1(or 4)-monophosphatase
VNFLYGIPQWSVSIAAEGPDGEALAGAVYDPVLDELWSAADGRALLDGEPVEASGETDLATALVATGFGYEAHVRAAQAAVVDRLLPQVRDIRRLGSAALDLCWTAAGRYDAYFERGVKPWDVAAGLQLCRGTGLAVHELPEGPGAPRGVLVAAPALATRLLPLVG